MTVTAVMVVRDEACVLPRCLASLERVCDRFVIVDTGSTDHTREIAADWLARHDGDLYERPWLNFAHNRTEALDLADDGHSLRLMLDADMTVHGELGPLGGAGAYMVEVRDSSDFSYWLPLLIAPGPGWRYEGVTHEYLTRDGPLLRANCDTLTVTHHCDGSRRPDKLHDDLVLLTAAFAADPTDERTVFYLAQTHRDLANVQEAVSLYRLRTQMGGWDEEVFYARYQLGCLLAANVSFAQGAEELLKAWRERPSRIEPLRALAHAASFIADQADPPADALFVHVDQYRRAG